MLGDREDNYLSQTFKALRNYAHLMKRAKKLKAQARQSNETGFFSLWRKQLVIEEIHKPEEEIAFKLIRKKRLAACFKVLYDYRIESILKKNLKKQAYEYFETNYKSKVLDSLNWYAEKMVHKRKLQNQSIFVFKRRFMNKWLESLLKTQEFKEKIISIINSEGQRMSTQGSKFNSMNTSMQSISSLNIKDLNTSEQLKQAHDLLSDKLKNILENDINEDE